MAKKNLTDRTLKTLKPAAAGARYDVMDAGVPGLGVRVTDSGHRTFVFASRFPGSAHYTRRALGEYGEVTLEAARAKARAWIELIRKGVDPQTEEERQRREQSRRQENSFAAVAEEFIKRQVVGPGYGQLLATTDDYLRAHPGEKLRRLQALAKVLHADDSIMRKMRKAAVVIRELDGEFIERWGDRPITEITQHDVVAVLDEAVERGAPYQAHNLLGHVRRLFNWAIGRDVYGLERSPCDRLKPADVIGKKKARSRILADDEIRAFWTATETTGYPFGPVFQLLAVTGQRKSEVAEASWSEFELERKLWTIPAERMKADAPHVVPLTAEAIAILAALPRFDSGEFLFSTRFGKSPVNGFGKAKARLDALMLAELQRMAAARGENADRVKLEDWVIHDIRRTVRTGLSALPVPDLVRELVIAHTKPGLHKVYDQHAYLDEKRHALELWAARLRSIITPAPANVVILSARAAS